MHVQNIEELSCDLLDDVLAETVYVLDAQERAAQLEEAIAEAQRRQQELTQMLALQVCARLQCMHARFRVCRKRWEEIDIAQAQVWRKIW